MSTHSDNVKNHAFFTQVDYARNLIVDLMENDTNINESDRDVLNRINLVLANAKTSFVSADAELISMQWMNEANTSIGQIISQLSLFKKNHIATNLNNAVNSLDALLNATAKANLIKSNQSFEISKKAMNEYSLTLNKVIESYREKLSNANDLNIEIQKRYDKLATDISVKNDEFVAVINSEKIRLDKLSTDHQSKMIQDQEKYSKSLQNDNEKFLSELKKYREEIDILKNETRERISNFSAESKSLIASTGEEFENYKNTVKNLVGLLSQDTFSYKYREVADDSYKRATFWHFWAVLFMIFVTGFAVYSFVLTSDQDSDWVKLAAKIFATTTMATIAGYAARQASKQEKVERYARKIEMELVAFDPFISSLDENSKSELKSEIAKRIFGNKDNDNMGIKDADESHHAFDKTLTMEELVKIIVGLIGKK